MENKKLKLTLISTTAAAVLLGLGAFALFTDNADTSTKAKGGTVEVDVDQPTLSNGGNINPGDNDETVPETYIPDPDDPLYEEDEDGNPIPVPVSTTSHELKFNVENLGNKSIRTRHTLIIKCASPEGEALDASVFSLLVSMGEELEVKSFVLDDGSEIAPEDLEDGMFVSAVKYVYTPDIFDGVGPDSEKEENSTVKAVTDDNGTETAQKEYTYLFKMAKEALNEYQGADISIDVIVEALQYRNTVSEDWQLMTSQTVTGKLTGHVQPTVPASDQEPATQEAPSGN